MSREDIVAIAVRLFAVFLGLYTLRTAFVLAPYAAQTEFDARMIVMALVIAAAMVGVVLLLWFFPLSVARKLLPVMKEPRSEPAAGADTLFSLGLMLMGLWLLANAIVDIVYWAVQMLSMRGTDMPMSELMSDQWAAMVATLAETGIALFLILGSTGIRNAIYRLRNAHVDTPPKPGE